MLTVFVFDEQESGREDDLRAALERLADDALLWIALLDPNATQIDPHAKAGRLVEMREVLTVIGSRKRMRRSA